MNMLRRFYLGLAAVFIAAISPALGQTQDDLRKAQELYDKAVQKKEPAARIQLLQQAAQLLAKEDQPTALPPAFLAQAAQIHFNLGREFYRQAKWPLAVFHFEKAFALHSNFGVHEHFRLMAQAHNGLALQHLRHGKPESARQSALAAVRYDSTFTPAYTTLGLVLFQQGKYEAAVAAYHKALQTNPAAQLYNNLGAAQEAKGELVAAVESYRRALELEEGLASAQKNLQRAREKLAAIEAEKPAVVDTLRTLAVRRDTTVTAAPKPPERSSKSKRAKSGKVEPPAKTPQKNSSTLALSTSDKTDRSKKKKVEEKTAKPDNLSPAKISTRNEKNAPGTSLVDTTAKQRAITPEKSPPLLMPSSAAMNSTPPKPSPAAREPAQAVRSPAPKSNWALKSLAFVSVIALTALVFVQRRRLGQAWLQMKPALIASTAEVSRQVRLLPSRIRRNYGVAGVRQSAPEQVAAANKEMINGSSVAAGINENLGPRQPSLQTQAFFAEMIAAEPEIADFDDEAPAASSTNGHIDAPPTLPESDKSSTDDLALRTPAPVIISIPEMENNNNGIAALPTPALLSNGAEISKNVFDIDSTDEKSNGLHLNQPAPINQEPAASNLQPEAGSSKPATNNGKSNLGRYLIEGEIGKGAMGNIYLAWDPKLDRRVVIKTVCFTLATSEVDTSTLKDRVYREARAIAKLGHPNIVVVYDVEDERDMSYIVMEHIEGRDLRQALQSERRFDYPRAIKIMAQVCSALDYAHCAGIVHRDIKPSNIMLLPGDKAKVTDFGIAKIADNFSLTLPGHILGTPSYMAPEQFEGHEIDGRADLFSLGVVFYELLTGARPFTGDSLASLAYKVVHKMHLPPSLQNVELPLELDEIVGKALAKNPEERYATALEFREALLGVEMEKSADFQSAKV